MNKRLLVNLSAFSLFLIACVLGDLGILARVQGLFLIAGLLLTVFGNIFS